MLQKLRERSQSESGFTLIELLVVVLILGILAAIAIPSFLNQRTKAQDAQAKSYVRTAQTAAETVAVDNNGQYGTVTPASLTAVEQTLTNAQALAATGTANSYSVSVTAPGSGNVFTIGRSAGGVITHTCTTAGTGGCQAGGTW